MNNQHGEPHRSLEGLGCLGMLAGNAKRTCVQRASGAGLRRTGIGIAPPPA